MAPTKKIPSNTLADGTGPLAGPFDLSTGRDRMRQFDWLNETPDRSTRLKQRSIYFRVMLGNLSRIKIQNHMYYYI